MSRETLEWLNLNTLIGFTDKRQEAWHFRADLQGAESNHYPGAIPPEDVVRRLFHWQAQSVPLEYTLPEAIDADGVTPARRFTDDTRQVIVRSDTGAVLGVFSDGYAIHQYGEWLLDNVANLLDDDLGIGSAGLLMGGGVGWVQVEVPDNIVTPEGVEYRPHLLAMTSHNGKRATGYARVCTNVVCDNTMAIAASEKGQKIKYKHTKYSPLKIADAREALNIVHAEADAFAAEVAELTAQSVSDQEWQKFLDAYVPIDSDASKRGATLAQNKIGELNRLYKHDDRVAPWNGTGWGVMQAVNTYEQHYSIAKNLGDGNKAQARFDRSLLAATDGSLNKQAETVRSILADVTA